MSLATAVSRGTVELGTSAACSYAAQFAGARVSLLQCSPHRGSAAVLQCCSAGRPSTEQLSADFIFLGVKRKHSAQAAAAVPVVVTAPE